MNIYVGHSREHDFKEELYKPLRESKLNEVHSIVLPHEKSDRPYNSKEYLKSTCDLVIAEISHKSSGLGVELGWASLLELPIIGIYKRGTKPSESLKMLSYYRIEYENEKELIEELTYIINKLH